MERRGAPTGRSDVCSADCASYAGPQGRLIAAGQLGARKRALQPEDHILRGVLALLALGLGTLLRNTHKQTPRVERGRAGGKGKREVSARLGGAVLRLVGALASLLVLRARSGCARTR